MMSGATEPRGTVEQALAHASQLLERSPELAAEQATEILKVAPHDARALLLLGLAQGALGQGEAAVAALRRAVQFAPGLGDAWRALADHLTAMGDTPGADAAYARHIQCSTRDPRLLRPAAALCENRIAEAEALLRAHLKAFPTDVPAIRMLAEVAARLGRYEDAENLCAAASSWRRDSGRRGRTSRRCSTATTSRRKPCPRSSSCWRPSRAIRVTAR
jgi:cytochrome c-type biogenesis protein CcmH/NrfG